MNTKAPRGNTILHQIVATSPDLASSTRKKYLDDLDVWLSFAGADPNGWTRYRAQDFYQSLLLRMKPQSANRLFASIRYASKWWATSENNPALDFAVIRIAPPARPKKFYPLDQIEATQLILTCESQTPLDRRDLALIVVGLETGMRRMSLAGMQLEAIGKPNGYPAVAVPLKGHGTDLYPVPLSSTAMQALDNWRQWLWAQKVKTGPVLRRLTKRAEATKRSVTIAWDVGDDGISETMIHKVIVHRAELAGIQRHDRHIHPHLLRHTFMTWRDSAGVSLSRIAAITGHDAPELGAMGGYLDKVTLGAEARETTPAWLAELVDQMVQG